MTKRRDKLTEFAYGRDSATSRRTKLQVTDTGSPTGSKPTSTGLSGTNLGGATGPNKDRVDSSTKTIALVFAIAMLASILAYGVTTDVAAATVLAGFLVLVVAYMVAQPIIKRVDAWAAAHEDNDTA